MDNAKPPVAAGGFFMRYPVTCPVDAVLETSG